jgi:predicted transcriptional regulator
MKVRNITVGIQPLEDGLSEFAHVVRSIQRGNTPKKISEGVSFVSLEAMRKVLTPKRFALLYMIRQKSPDSVYELAQLVKRDLKNVQDDVAMLSRIGLLSLSRARSTRRRVVPRVDYDRLQLQIPLV